MAKVKTVVTVTVEDDMFDYDDLCSFQTKNYFGEWVASECGYAIFRNSEDTRVALMIKIIQADTLEELAFQVKCLTGEDIIDAYDEYITTINIDIPM